MHPKWSLNINRFAFGKSKEMDNSAAKQTSDQYSLAEVLGIWLLGGMPMWILGWLVYPVVGKGLAVAGAGLWRLQLRRPLAHSLVPQTGE